MVQEATAPTIPPAFRRYNAKGHLPSGGPQGATECLAIGKARSLYRVCVLTVLAFRSDKFGNEVE